MKVIKKINNNVALCIDDNGNELIAFGKGIGFPATPYTLKDLSTISRTYYGINQEYVGLFREIPKDVLDTAGRIVDYATMKIHAELNPNVFIILADHINFALERYKKNMNVKPPYMGNIAYLHEVEYEIGKKAVSFINQQHHVHFPKEEAIAIAIHFINAEMMSDSPKERLDEGELISSTLDLIEQMSALEIDRSGFNCNRFITHMEYLLTRIQNNDTLTGDSLKLYDMLKRDYPQVHAIAQAVRDFLHDKTGKDLGNEEVTYLMLHIDRLCSREQTEKV